MVAHTLIIHIQENIFIVYGSVTKILKGFLRIYELSLLLS